MIHRGSLLGRVLYEEVVILGGGLCGLTAAVMTGAPVFEAADVAGGVASSDTASGFVFDRGIHILQTKNQAVLDMLAELGVDFTIHKRRAFIYSHETYTPYPFQINTAGLPAGLRARCLWEYFRRERYRKLDNYEDWIYKTIGRGFGDTFLIPYSEKFWTVHPRELTFEWANGRVPQPTARQVLRGAIWAEDTAIGSNARFRYPVGTAGYGALANALRKRAGTIHLAHSVRRLNTTQREIEFTNGLRVRYQYLINTIPLPELISICEDAPEHITLAAGRLRTNSIFVVNLGIDRPNLSDRHWIHFPEKEVSFFRISYPHNFAPGVAPKGTSSISAEVAYSESRPLDKATIVDRVIDDLKRVRAMGQSDRIIVRTTHDIRYAYCLYDKNRKEALRAVLGWLRDVGVTSCGRYGLWTYFWSDESMLSGKKAAQNAMRQRQVSSH